MGSPVIFAGTTAKSLKSNLDLNGNGKILSGAVDPSSSATSAPEGSIYLSTSTGLLYKKTDAGSSTNWTVITTSSTSTNNVNTSAGDYTVTSSDSIIERSGSGANTTVTLPGASTLTGYFFTINCTAVSGNFGVIVTDGGSYSLTLYTANECLTVYSDGTVWRTHTHYIPSVDTSAASSWTGSTSAPSKGQSGSPTLDNVIWWREGVRMCGWATYSQTNATGAAAGSGVMMLTVPAGWTIESSSMIAPASLSDGKGVATQVGNGVIGSDTAGLNTSYQAGLFYYDTTHMYVQYQLNNSNAEVFGSASTIVFTSTALSYAFYFEIPISGWTQ